MLIDPERIGVAGFSNGGYTSLLLVGGGAAIHALHRLLQGASGRPAREGGLRDGPAESNF